MPFPGSGFPKIKGLVFTPGGGFGIPEMENAGDFVAVPIPASFRILPWAPGTGWLLCDGYLDNGREVPFSTRRILKTAMQAMTDEGFDYIAGIEIECHIYRLEDPMLPTCGKQSMLIEREIPDARDSLERFYYYYA